MSNSSFDRQFEELQFLISSEANALSVSSILEEIGDVADIFALLDSLGAIPDEKNCWYIPQHLEASDRQTLKLYQSVRRQSQSRILERRLLRELIDQENNRADAVQLLAHKSKPLVVDRATSSTDEKVAFLVISDNHLAEVISLEETFGLNEHNAEICRNRVMSVIEQLSATIRTVRNFNRCNRIVVLFIGDHMHGDIHESYNLTGGNEFTALDEALEVTRLLLTVLKEIQPLFSVIDVVCVPGNHGRTTRKPITNQNNGYSYEQHLFAHLADRCSDLGWGNVEFHTSLQKQQIIEVFGHTIRIMHGDEIRAGTITNIQKQLQKLNDVSQRRADLTIMGHYHTLHCSHDLIINGCTVGPNAYSLGRGYRAENPSQLMFTLGEQGVSAFFPLYT